MDGLDDDLPANELLSRKSSIETVIRSMSNEMEVDEDTTTETFVNTSNVEPLLQTSPVEKGIKWCIICFSGATKKTQNVRSCKK